MIPLTALITCASSPPSEDMYSYLQPENWLSMLLYVGVVPSWTAVSDGCDHQTKVLTFWWWVPSRRESPRSLPNFSLVLSCPTLANVQISMLTLAPLRQGHVINYGVRPFNNLTSTEPEPARFIKSTVFITKRVKHCSLHIQAKFNSYKQRQWMKWLTSDTLQYTIFNGTYYTTMISWN